MLCYNKVWIYTNNNTNTGRPCRFGYERVHFFLPSVLSDTRRETQIIKAYANHTILTPPHARRTLWCLRSQLISLGRDPNWSVLIRSEKLSCTLQQSNSTVFSKSSKSLDHLFWARRQPPTLFTPTAVQPHFLFGGLLWQMMIVISFPSRCKTASSDYSTWTRRHRVVQRLTKLNDKI